MADKTPIRGAYNGSSLTGLAEYATGDTVGVSFGGTGLATVGSNQLLTGNGTSALTSESNLTYDGTTLATTAFTATGNVSLDGGTFVFNESGADKDFRVEGDSEANLLMIDASTDRIGIGTATPSHLLDVEGVANFATCIVTPVVCTTGNTVVGGDLTIGGDDLTMGTNTSGALLVADGTNYNPVVMSGDASISTAGAVTLAASNTNLTTLANVTSVGTLTSLNSSGNVSFDGGTFIFNESGADKDFRIEGDSEANLFVADASVDRIGIGTATPSHLVDIEGVAHAATCFVSADVCATTKVVTPALCVGSQYALPAADGSAGEILCTDGSGAITFAEAASSGHTIAEEGSVLASRTCLNFVGAGVTATDNSGTNATDVTVCATNALLGFRVAAGTACCITLSNAAVGTCLQSDTAPKLGGNLDVNSNSIISASNGNIPITPNGSGIVILDGICHPTADGSAGQVLCTNGSAALQWATLSAGVTLNGSTDNTIATVTGSNALQGEANLTFDGTTLNVVGNAGVGIARTDGTLHVHTASAGSVTASVHYDDLVVEGSGNTGISILAPEDYTSGIAFGSNNDNDVGYIYAQQSGTAGSRFMAFGVNAAERMRILSSGGITFNGDTGAANALDDYEEGTFTPVLGAHSSDGTHSYTTQVGNYTKVGNVVHIWLKLVINTLNTSGTISGNLEIKGLPFTSANTTGQLYMGTFLPSGLAVSGTGPVTMMGINGTTVSMAEANDNAGYSMFTSSDVASGDSFFIQFSYPV